MYNSGALHGHANMVSECLQCQLYWYSVGEIVLDPHVSILP